MNALDNPPIQIVNNPCFETDESAWKEDFDIGDIVLCHGDHFMSKVIRFGQRLRFRSRYAKWNHCALVISQNGDLVEALGNGVVKSRISKYKWPNYEVIKVSTLLSEEDKWQVLEFAHNVLKARWKYGYFTILSLFFTLLFGGKFQFGQIGTAICSGFVSEAVAKQGVPAIIFPVPPSYMMPANVSEYFSGKGL